MTELVGILNITPDSFSDGGQWSDPYKVLGRVNALRLEGADLIDIGAESTRPGAHEITANEEWQRLRPVIGILREYYPACIFSIDTRHAQIARRAINSWSSDLIINDVTGVHDPAMAEVLAEHGSRDIVSHLPAASGGDIAKAHTVTETNLNRVIDELHTQIEVLVGQGIERGKIIADPGIGFGKHRDLNRELVTFAQYTDYPVTIGYSRKRFLGERRLDPAYNAEIGKIAAASGAAYLRVHDVTAHRGALRST